MLSLILKIAILGARCDVMDPCAPITHRLYKFPLLKISCPKLNFPMMYLYPSLSKKKHVYIYKHMYMYIPFQFGLHQ